MKRIVIVGLAVTAACSLWLVACSDGGKSKTSSTPTLSVTPVPTSTSSPPPTVDPFVKGATDAFLAYTQATDAAFSSPENQSLKVAIEKVSYAPDQVEVENSIDAIARTKAHLGGGPHTPQFKVTEVMQTAKPFPSITLVECSKLPAAYGFYSDSGARLPLAPGHTSPPYQTTVKMILGPVGWGVQTSQTDYSHTCVPGSA